MGLGATVTVTTGGRKEAQALLSQGSYYSVDDRGCTSAWARRKADRIGCAGRADRWTLSEGRGRPPRGHGARAVGSWGLRARSSTSTAAPSTRSPSRACFGLVFVRTGAIANRYAPEIRRLRGVRREGRLYKLVFGRSRARGGNPRALRTFDLPAERFAIPGTSWFGSGGWVA
jgi:hypothetical protein